MEPLVRMVPMLRTERVAYVGCFEEKESDGRPLDLPVALPELIPKGPGVDGTIPQGSCHGPRAFLPRCIVASQATARMCCKPGHRFLTPPTCPTSPRRRRHAARGDRVVGDRGRSRAIAGVVGAPECTTQWSASTRVTTEGTASRPCGTVLGVSAAVIFPAPVTATGPAIRSASGRQLAGFAGER